MWQFDQTHVLILQADAAQRVKARHAVDQQAVPTQNTLTPLTEADIRQFVIAAPSDAPQRAKARHVVGQQAVRGVATMIADRRKGERVLCDHVEQPRK